MRRLECLFALWLTITTAAALDLHHNKPWHALMNPSFVHQADDAPSLLKQLHHQSQDDKELSSPVDYAPLRPPAVPLAVRGTYTNAWQSTADDGLLNTAGVMNWNGNPIGWNGLVSVDGVAYRWMGRDGDSGHQLAIQKSLHFDSQYSNYTFVCGGVELTASFFSPVTPSDYCRLSVPLSYLAVAVKAIDGHPHDVKLYNDVDGGWITSDMDAPLQWKQVGHDGLNTFLIEQQNAITFGDVGDQPYWGNLTFSTTGNSLTLRAGSERQVQAQFTSDGRLDGSIDPKFRSRNDNVNSNPVFAFSHDLGTVTKSPSSVLYTVGTVQDPAVQYLCTGGLERLQPWWKRCFGGSLLNLIHSHYHDYNVNARLANAFEEELKQQVLTYYGTDTLDAKAVDSSALNEQSGRNEYGEEFVYAEGSGYMDPETKRGVAPPGIKEPEAYYAIVALSSRQLFGSYTLTERASTSKDRHLPFFIQRETSSDSNVQTTDVMFPAWPFFVAFNVDLLRLTLDPVFEITESGFYPNKYALHDIGAVYPNATGHVEGNDEYMPVEESGNQIISTWVYSHFAKDTDYLKDHYSTLSQYAEYLIEYSLTPAKQLSTDDFGGHLVNQTNLAMKGIVGLKAMSRVAEAIGNPADSKYYADIASDYYSKWKGMGVDPTGSYTLLSYNWRSSWGMLYNTYPAHLADLDIDDRMIRETTEYTKPLLDRSQKFGIPLDNRHTWTKSDWSIWIAASSDEQLRRYIITTMALFLDSTQSGRPFIDLYETPSGEFPEAPHFLNRPVVGGHFALLAMLKKH